MTICVAGCAAPGDRIDKAGAIKADASLVGRALAQARAATASDLPAHPEDCRKTETVRVRAGDRLDGVVVAYDRALTAANARIGHCADWYDALRRARTDGLDNGNRS